FERGIGPAFQAGDVAVVFQRLVVFLALKVEIADGAGEALIAGLLVQAGAVLTDQVHGHFVALHFATLLFEGGGLAFVLEDVAIGAAPGGKRVVAAFLKGALGGEILQGLVDFGVAGVGFLDFG